MAGESPGNVENLENINPFPQATPAPEENLEDINPFATNPPAPTVTAENFPVMLSGELENIEDINPFAGEVQNNPVALLSRFNGTDSYIANVNPEMITAEGIDPLGITYESIWRNGSAGWFWKSLETLTIPEQFAARGLGNILVNSDFLNHQDSAALKIMLNQSQFHASDMVDYFWRATGPVERGFKAAVGLGADILIDPLTYMSLGVAPAFKVGTKVMNLRKVSNLTKMKAFRGRQLQELISKDGQVLKQLGPTGAKKVTLNNERLIDSFVETKITAEDLLAAVDVRDPNITKQIDTLAAKLEKPPSILERTKGFGFSKGNVFSGAEVSARIPFTNIKTPDYQMDFVSGLVGKGLYGPLWAMHKLPGAIDDTIELALFKSNLIEARNLYKGAKNVGLSAGRLLQQFKTDTAFPLFNTASRRLLGKFSLTDTKSLEAENVAAQWAKDLPDNLHKDFAQEFERTTTRSVEDTIKRFKLNAQQAAKLTEVTPEDIARRARIEESGLGEFYDETAQTYRDQMVRRLEAIEQRGLPFEELHPVLEDQSFVRGYMKHVVSRDWLSHLDDTEQMLESIEKISNKVNPKVDNGLLRRKIRDSAVQVNSWSKIKKKFLGKEFEKKVPLFSENFITAHNQRLREMDKLIAKHDFVDEIKPLVKFEPTPGYVRVKTENWRTKIGDVDSPMSTLNFMPKWFRDHIKKNGDQIYLPANVANRVDHLISPRQFHPFLSMAFKALNTFNTLFRNAALFGLDYLGQNLFGNLITYGYAGGSVKHLTNVLKLAPNAAPNKIFSFNKGALKLKRDDLLDLMSETGITRTSMVDEINFDQFVKNAATVSDMHKKNLTTYLDYATFYRANRWASRMGDDLPKMAFFMSKLDEGYTPLAAAEATDYWFFNFQNVPPGQKVLRNLIPFSTFAAKTAEQGIDLIKSGKLGTLNFPAKVQNVLQGAFIPNDDVSEFLDGNLAEYKQHWHPVHGPIMPGMRQIQADIPFAKSTIAMLLAPAQSRHPIIKMLGAAFGEQHPVRDFSPMLQEKEFDTQLGRYLDLVLPPNIRHMLALSELNGNADIPFMNFKGKYSPRILFEKAKKGELNLRAEDFEGSIAIGEAMAQHYGNDWMFHLFTLGGSALLDPNPKENNEKESARKYKNATVANFLKGYFRDLTLGTARLERLDRNILFNMSAVRRQRNALGREIEKRELTENGAVFDLAGFADSKEKQDQVLKNVDGEKQRMLAEWLALQGLEDHLIEYYGFFKMNESKTPGFTEGLFGLGEDNFNFQPSPDNRSSKFNIDQRTEEFYLQMLEEQNPFESEQ
jgi:hypothetical protein